MSAYPRLFEPAYIGRLPVRNRLIGAPMERNYCHPDGAVNQRYIDYLVARAAGGVGTMLVESTFIDPVGRNRPRQLGVHDDRLLPGLRRLTQAVHAHGARIGLELQFAGRQTSALATGRQPVAPSAVPCSVLTGGDLPRELTADEIGAIVSRFAEAAQRAQEAGFDLVELHGAHGYLLGQFLSPYSNCRTDAYGGSAGNRMRFPLEVVAAVRAAVGDDFPLAYRLSADEFWDGGLTIEDIVPFACRLEAAGVDLIDVTAGIYESAVMIVMSWAFPPGCLAYLSEAIKEAVDVPVSVVGRVGDPALAERILEANQADFVVVGRALHADPEFPRKAQEGRAEEIRHCMGCMTCSDLLGLNVPVLCTINTTAGREREFAPRPASVRKRVVVAGGGPAGLEAARVAAQRGHQVVLLEKEQELGGQVRLASHLPRKDEFAELTRYLTREVARLGVDVRLGQEADAEMVEGLSPDVAVVATGARPAWSFIPGATGSHVRSAFDVLSGDPPAGRRVLIAGGRLLGCELAAYLADRDCEVVVVEPAAVAAADYGPRTSWLVVERVRTDPRIELRLRSTVERIDPGAVVVQSQGRWETIEKVDLVVLTDLAPCHELADELQWRGKVPEVYAVGDCFAPRKALDATQEGAAIGHRI